MGLSSLPSLGSGQGWSSVIGSRASGVTYYNTTGRPIVVSVTSGGAGVASLVVSGVTVVTLPVATQQQMIAVVPPGASYVVTVSTPQSWAELR